MGKCNSAIHFGKKVTDFLIQKSLLPPSLYVSLLLGEIFCNWDTSSGIWQCWGPVGHISGRAMDTEPSADDLNISQAHILLLLLFSFGLDVPTVGAAQSVTRQMFVTVAFEESQYFSLPPHLVHLQNRLKTVCLGSNGLKTNQSPIPLWKDSVFDAIKHKKHRWTKKLSHPP